MKSRIALFTVLLLISGCALNLPNGGGTACTDIFIYGLTVNLTDGNGDPVTGATLVITEATYTETLVEIQDGYYTGAGERAGTYSVTVTATGFEPVTIDNIVVTADECHVIPVGRDITLSSTP